MGGLGLVHPLYRAHRAVVPAIARLLSCLSCVKASCVYDRGGLSRNGTDHSSSLTAALVPSAGGTPVITSGPGLSSSLPATVAVSKSAPPQSFVYENSKTYAVLGNCNGSSSTAAATVEHCQADKLRCVQTTHDDDSRLVSKRVGLYSTGRLAMLKLFGEFCHAK